MARRTASPIRCWRSQDEVGAFGTLLYAGKDWKDRELGRQSMILMAEQVMPRVNAGHLEHIHRRGIIRRNLEKVRRGSLPIASPIRRRSTGRN